MLFLSQALARLFERELHRQQPPQLLELGQLGEAAADRFDGRRDEVEVVQAAADDRRYRERPQHLDRALEQRLEVATAERFAIGAEAPRVIVDELELRLVA